MSKKDLARAHIGVMLGMLMQDDMPIVDKPSLEEKLSDKDAKECAYSKCNKQHWHNNSCCSGEHFKLYMKEKRQTTNGE